MICGYSLRNPKPISVMGLNKINHCLLVKFGQRGNFYPFGEIVYPNQNVTLAFRWSRSNFAN